MKFLFILSNALLVSAQFRSSRGNSYSRRSDLQRSDGRLFRRSHIQSRGNTHILRRGSKDNPGGKKPKGVSQNPQFKSDEPQSGNRGNHPPKAPPASGSTSLSVKVPYKATDMGRFPTSRLRRTTSAESGLPVRKSSSSSSPSSSSLSPSSSKSSQIGSPATEMAREQNWLRKGKWIKGTGPFDNQPFGMTGVYTSESPYRNARGSEVRAENFSPSPRSGSSSRKAANLNASPRSTLSSPKAESVSPKLINPFSDYSDSLKGWGGL